MQFEAVRFYNGVTVLDITAEGPGPVRYTDSDMAGLRKVLRKSCSFLAVKCSLMPGDAGFRIDAVRTRGGRWVSTGVWARAGHFIVTAYFERYLYMEAINDMEADILLDLTGGICGPPEESLLSRQGGVRRDSDNGAFFWTLDACDVTGVLPRERAQVRALMNALKARYLVRSFKSVVGRFP